MANEVITAMDPLGNTIHLLDRICDAEPGRKQEIYDDAATVIQKPAMLIEVSENNSRLLYYFRSIGWQHTLLIVARYFNEHWEAYECVKNPSHEELAALLKKGKQII